MATLNLGKVKGTTWYKGTSITGDSTESTVFSESGVTYAIEGDYYVNTDTGYFYICTGSGAPDVATWSFFLDPTEVATEIATIAQGYAEEAQGYAEIASAAQTAAETAQTSAASYASDASSSATEAMASKSSAALSESNASTSEMNAALSETNAATSETNAATSEANAEASATAAAASAAEASRLVQTISNAIKYMGSVTFANIPTTGLDSGYCYNITDAFTTDSRFVEGSGVEYDAGTNIVYTADGYWDVVGGDLTDLRNELATKLDSDGDSKSNTVTFTSQDAIDSTVDKTTGWTSVNKLISGLTHSTLLYRISQMMQNVRWLYKYIIGNIVPTSSYNTSTAYNVGDVVTYNKTSYICTTACSAGSWSTNSSCFTESTLLVAHNELNANLTNRFPVGSIIHSTTCSTMALVVAAYGGTTWIQHTGYFLRGASSGVTAGSATSTGGEDTHTLTTSEMPSHNHTWGSAFSKSGTNNWTVDNNSSPTAQQAFTVYYSGTTSSTGGGSAHNNIPKYKSVYIWERTA